MKIEHGLNQKPLMDNLPKLVPSTRYQGSKRRILPWIYENLKDLKFDTVLDGFGGTASVSYLFKLMGKTVTFNDILSSNYQTGLAFIENNSVKLNHSDIEFLCRENGFEYPDFIQRTFKDIYYLESENKWLDMISFNIKNLSRRYKGDLLRKKRALAFHALSQACLCKRPFNLFHRKNLYLRTADVKRNFGNKKTWDTGFSRLFNRFVEETSRKVFSNNRENIAVLGDIMRTKNKDFDLVYLDPPYTRPNEKCPKDYYSLYHFLEGLANYKNWPSMIDWSKNHKCLLKTKTEWEKNTLEKNFTYLFEKFQNSVIVVSYGHPGTPPIPRIKRLLQRFKSKVSLVKKEYSYKLNHKNGSGMNEVLIIGR